MRLKVLAHFTTVITVGGSNVAWAGEPGATFEVEDTVAAALLRDLPGVVVIGEPEPEPVEAITAASPAVVETVVEMVEIPAEVVPEARTRQVARKPRPVKAASSFPAAKAKPVVKPVPKAAPKKKR